MTWKRSAVVLLAAPLALAACSSNGGGGKTATPPATQLPAPPSATAGSPTTDPAATTPATTDPSTTDASTTDASTGTTTAAPSGTPASTAAPSAVPVTPRCHTSQLSATAGDGQGAAGTIYLTIVLSNTSGETCTLDGYPGMGLLDASRRPLPTTVVRGGGMLPPSRPSLVRLPPAAKASYSLTYSDVPTGGASAATQCPTASSAYVTPPDERDPLLLQTRLAPCRGELHVSPLVAGTGGASG